MSVTITRHYATVEGNRQVQYRRAGEGPPVILLHQSPTSSKEYTPLIQQLAENYTVIAPDTPGNGMSDPLPIEEPVMTDYANHVAALMDELGIEKCPVYGFHTGGLCALELAWRHPEKLTVGVMNGYIQMTPEERQEILDNYFAVFQPDWSGSHLTWAWSRFREQTIFFPWFRKDGKSRMNYDIPPAFALQEAVMEFFRAGDNYRQPYRCAFTADTVSAVEEMKGNMVVMTAKTDVLWTYHQRLGKTSDNVTKVAAETAADAIKHLVGFLSDNVSHQASLEVAPTKPLPGKIWGEYFQVEGFSFYARRNTDGSGRPVVMQHSSAGSSFSMDRLMTELIGERPVIAFDLPGNGESDNPIGLDIKVEDQADWLAKCIRAAGYDEVDFVGNWGGGTVGVELAIQHPSLVKNLAIPSLICLDDVTREEYLANYTPDLEYDDYGCHLIKAWNILRDQELYTPWYRRKKDHVIHAAEPDIAPDLLQRRVVDLFKCIKIWQSAYAAHFSYPMTDKLSAVKCPVLLGSPNSNQPNRAVSFGIDSHTVRSLPKEAPALASELLMFFA